ncbi:MAG: acetylxylan esterase, partial [Lentisphaerae bacterium]
VGLKDPICPPENVYAACNKIQSELKICPYPFGEHDGGHAVHEDTKLHFVAEHIS